ncbi:ribosome hibernation-promoting factor, HPF/YfiA family [Brachybacterium aquaticum]|uniref:Ribosome hibernation promoting factor n=1 Tax=Brachybacterium aquaticum TaxID=1432564 RepID=A0A841AAH6_9MICO|nr:ribosome-associated translation inhibitor RaiA [Brachybacterium aquaticum]MBB5830943.1 ribosomal subunit interface protein [Brachybacterium aquaticum]
MEINVVGRHMDVPDRFRRHLTDKLDKVTQFAPAALRVDVEISQEKNPRQAELSDRVELTVHENGAVIRSEARADDLYGALDIAYGKLLERLRRARDRRKDHRRGRDRAHQGTGASLRTMPADQELPEPLQAAEAVAEPDETTAPADDLRGDEADLAEAGSPVVIREKKHPAKPMSVDDALYQMELVGHDFFLFVDAESGNPKVVYRRKGWSYGVIELDGEQKAS